MTRNRFLVLNAGLVACMLFGCKQQYLPPINKSNLGYLVVDGFIINGTDPTTINLSRTQNVTDSNYTQNPETGAQVSVIGQNSGIFSLNEKGNGTYSIDSLNLNDNEKYQLKIITSNGNVYLSDTLSVKSNPPIDSVSWINSGDGVHIYVSTHDPQNNTRYYRWDYEETYEYHSAYYSNLIYENGTVDPRPPSQQINKCWKTNSSTNLLLGSTANLSQDVVYQMPVTFIPSGSEKISVEYSILVKQYALSQQTFNYWQTLQKNTEQTGSLFDPQPSQLTGNIYNIANKNEPVIGYISISSEKQQRIFINRNDLAFWPYQPPSLTCSQFTVPMDSTDYYFQRGYMPVDNTFPASIGYISSTTFCVDCTVQGGVTVKPSYWPF